MKTGIDDLIYQGADAAVVESLPRIDFTPTLAREALYGLAGRIVESVEPYSEADPAGILAHVLTAAGNVIGRGPHALVEHTLHPCSEFIALVGASGKGRKGQAWSSARWLFTQVDEQWATTRVRTGLSSGEGLIYHVRDSREEIQPVKERGRVVDEQRVVVDHGEPDKRLFVFEPEFVSVLRRAQGETNSLSAVLRQAWETGDLSTLTKNSPLRATGAHISVVAHVTQEELVATLTDIERVNGFANRFLFVLVRRSKCLPEGEPAPVTQLAPLAEELRQVVAFAQGPRLMRRDPAARELWAGIYPKLSAGEVGLLGAVLGRAEAHVLRLSVLYAVLNRSPLVRTEHIKAALGFWDYCEASARRIFGARLGLSVADRILELLQSGRTMTRDEIREAFHRNKPAAEIEAALHLLEENGKARRSFQPPVGGKGRPAETWRAIRGPD